MRFSLQPAILCGLVLACGGASTRAAFCDEVRVRVLAPDEKPVVGARVWVSSRAPEPQSAQTDATGTATFDLQPLAAGATFPGSKSSFGNAIILAPDRAIEGGHLKSGDNVFRLGATRSVRGRVLDDAGKPVANVRVAIHGLSIGDWNDRETFRYLMPPDEARDEFAVRSDAEGNWQIGVPATASVNVILSDERYANATAYEQSGKSAVLTLTALPGAILEGRVVDPTGKPVANARVEAREPGERGGIGANAKTGADGAYRLIGATPSDALQIIVVAPADVELVAPPLGNIAAKAGASTRVQDIAMIPGVELGGLVTDSATGKPVEGAMVYVIIGAGRATQHVPAASDAEGKWRARVLPGQVSLAVTHPDYGIAGRGGGREPLQITVAEGAAMPPQNFALTPKVAISGTVVDENGKPIPNAKFSVGAQPWDAAQVIADAAGKWSAKTDADMMRVWGSKEWQVASPKTPIKVDKPLRVVLQRPTYESVSGRVVTSDGKPLAGVALEIMAGSDEPMTVYEAPIPIESAADGRYEFKILSGQRPYGITAKLNGHAVVSAPEHDKFVKQATSWSAPDIIMAKLDARLRGRVLAADGKPVAGALVMGGKGAISTTETAADGTFTLENLSAGELLVTAVSGNASGSATGKAAEKPAEVALTLRAGAPPKPRDVQRAYQLLARVLDDAKGKPTWNAGAADELMQPFDAALAAKLRAKTGTPPYNAGALWVETFGNPEPERVLPRAEEYIERAEQREKKVLRAFFDLIEGLQIAQTDAPRAAQLLANAETILRAMTAADRAQAMSDTVIACGAAGALASRLGKPSAEGWFDFAMILIDTEYPKDPGSQDGVRSWVLEWALRGGPKMYDRVARELSSSVRAAALAAAIEKPRTDLKTALALLDRIEALPDEKPGAGPNYRGDRKSLFGQAAITLIGRVGKDDPAAALSLARRVQSEQHKSLALALAAQAQSGEARLALLREAFDAQARWQPSAGARIAAMIYDADAAAGKPLFDKLRRNFEEQQKQQPEMSGYYDSGTPQLAFYLARADAPAARRLLELGFVRMRAGSQSRNSSWQLPPFVLAMAALDFDRALEMSLLLEDSAYATVQRNLAEYVLASEAERRTLDFEEWQRGNWHPRADG